MQYELLRHKLAYFSLILGLVGMTILFLAVWPNLALQRGVVVLMSVYYFSWGIITHVKTDHITRKVLYEYAGISILAGLLLLLITL
jgi:hypothetical protein